MEDDQAEDPAELIDAGEAARLLEVAPDRVQVMVDEGLLTPADDGVGVLFMRSEVEAIRLLGG
jgi:hypothetical protein